MVAAAEEGAVFIMKLPQAGLTRDILLCYFTGLSNGCYEPLAPTQKFRYFSDKIAIAEAAKPLPAQQVHYQARER